MDYIIDVKELRKEFTSHSSRSGLKGAFRDLFTRNYTIKTAVDDISFRLKRGRWSVISAKTARENQQRSKCLPEF